MARRKNWQSSGRRLQNSNLRFLRSNVVSGARARHESIREPDTRVDPAPIAVSRLLESLARRLGVIRPTRAYVVSYPKSGRTWLRALIGKYLVESYGLPEISVLDTELLTRKAGLWRTTMSHDGSEMVSPNRYTDLDPNKSKFAGSRVLLLGRDIRDTLVSAFFQASRRVGVFEGTMSEFIRSERFGVLKILTFYDHWLASRQVPEAFLFLRYESLHDDPEAALTRTLTFLGEHRVNHRAVASAVQFCVFENLQRAETENRFRSEILRPANDDDPESYKVRRGIVGGYTDYLSEADVTYIDGQIARTKFDFRRFDD